MLPAYSYRSPYMFVSHFIASSLLKEDIDMGFLRQNYETYASRQIQGPGRQARYERIVASVPYYNHNSIPISDVFAALGTCKRR